MKIFKKVIFFGLFIVHSATIFPAAGPARPLGKRRVTEADVAGKQENKETREEARAKGDESRKRKGVADGNSDKRRRTIKEAVLSLFGCCAAKARGVRSDAGVGMRLVAAATRDARAASVACAIAKATAPLVPELIPDASSYSDCIKVVAHVPDDVIKQIVQHAKTQLIFGIFIALQANFELDEDAYYWAEFQDVGSHHEGAAFRHELGAQEYALNTPESKLKIKTYELEAQKRKDAKKRLREEFNKKYFNLPHLYFLLNALNNLLKVQKHPIGEKHLLAAFDAFIEVMHMLGTLTTLPCEDDLETVVYRCKNGIFYQEPLIRDPAKPFMKRKEKHLINHLINACENKMRSVVLTRVVLFLLISVNKKLISTLFDFFKIFPCSPLYITQEILLANKNKRWFCAYLKEWNMQNIIRLRFPNVRYNMLGVINDLKFVARYFSPVEIYQQVLTEKLVPIAQHLKLMYQPSIGKFLKTDQWDEEPDDKPEATHKSSFSF